MKRVRKKELIARLLVVEAAVHTLIAANVTTRTKLNRALADISAIERRQRDRQ